MNKSPIFIHSLFRSGSTYLFKVFRRSAAEYYCYQEAVHELVIFSREDPSALHVDHGEAKLQLLRHPGIERPYFQELFETWPAWRDAINERTVYDAYFADTEHQGDIGVAYWRALIDAAKGKPVFQECRTAGRIGAIKQQLGGQHLFLWRNPWDQWWSYKVTPYFDVANLLIIHARHAPPSVQRLRAELNVSAYPGDDLAGAFAFYNAQPITSEHSYLVFYLLWCLAQREGTEHADLLLNIDRLSDSEAYRRDVLKQLTDAGIGDLDFSDCRVPQGRYLARDIQFFDNLEKRVHLWLDEDGWTAEDLDRTQTLRRQLQPASWAIPLEELRPEDLTEQAARARELAIRFETSTAERTLEERVKLDELDVRFKATAAAAQCSETKAQQAEARAQQTETRAQQAEARAQQTETRAQQAEARAQQAETRAQQAETRAQQAEARAQQTETRAQQAEAKAQQAEAESKQVLTQLHAVYASTSWRITSPLRWVGFQLQLLKQHGLKSRTKAAAKRILPRAVSFVGSRPRLKRFALVCTQRLGLTDRLRRIHFAASAEKFSHAHDAPAPADERHLTPRARQIYADLKMAIEKNEGSN